MRSLQDSRPYWRNFFDTYNSKDSLKQDILKKQHASDLGDAGVRSLCWKLFLYLPDFPSSTWSPVLTSSRDVFTTLRAKLLAPLETGSIDADDDDSGHPFDPLAEDPKSPWSKLRKDEELRREIIQDVERCMPDHDYFRSEKVQKQLLDILFVYCKLNEHLGYRQGMHEIVAPILWIVDHDSVQADFSEVSEEDKIMLEVFDPAFVVHDTFSLFQVIMHSARAWYELGEDGESSGKGGNSPIVEKSRVIHEELLTAVDPQLARHLKELEILPQVFLIRWIRLLFGREFPFEQLLVLWDSLFAKDPDFCLVDYICVAMLLRIRWELLEYDYSMVLTLLLRYPAPKPPHLPATLVSDAIYLRKNLNIHGGSHIISKYSGRTPALVHPPQSPPASPSQGARLGDSPLRRAMSPIAGQTARMINAHGGFDWLMNDFAKGVVDKGKGWGLNKPIERFMEELQRNKMLENTSTTVKQGTVREDRRKRLALQERNEILQEALEKSYKELQVAVGDRPELQNALHRIQLVQVCLHDSTIDVDRSFFKDQPQQPRKLTADGEVASSTENTAQESSPPSIPNPPPQEQKVIITPSPLQVFPHSPSPLPPLPQSPLPPLSQPPSPLPPNIDIDSTQEDQQREKSPTPPPPTLLPPPPPKHEKKALLANQTPRSQQIQQPQPPPPPPKPHNTSSPFPATGFKFNPSGNSIDNQPHRAESFQTHRARSSLAQSGFAWMLGEDPLEVRNKDVFGFFGDRDKDKERGDEKGELFGDEGSTGSGIGVGAEAIGTARRTSMSRRNNTSQRAMLFGEE